MSAPPGVYYVRVYATNAAGSGPDSNEVAVVVGAGAVPGAPQHLSAIVSGHAFTLAWAAPANFAVAAIDTFIIEAGSASGLSNVAVVTTGTPAMQFVTPTVPSGSYFVRVRARNAAGTGPASAEIRVVIGPPPPGPPVLSGEVGAAGSVSLSWTAPAAGAPVTGYQLRAGSAPGLSNLAVVEIGAGQRSFSTTGVPPGRYYVRVVALSAQGPGEDSNEVTLVVP